MPWLRQSTAANLKLGPFLDDTDGKTAETGLTISQSDVLLSKNGGALTQKHDTAAATHDTAGYYTCAINTTDTNTVGRLKAAVSESGALPVWEEHMVLPANVYDSFVAGSDNLDVTLANGAQGGTSMVITFSRMIGSSAHADGTVRLDNSAGAGLHVQSSKVAGHAVHFQATGLGTSHGLWCKSDGDNANASGAFFDGSVGLTCTGLSAGLWATGSSGTGFLSNSSAGYPGMVCMSGIQVVPAGDHGLYLMPSTDGHALYAPGNGTGSGICAEAGASGYDILADIQGALSGAVGSVAAEVDADVKKIDANSTAATVLKTLYASAVAVGSVDTPGGSETAAAFTSDLTETTPDHYNGCVLVLTSGDAQVQTRRISDYNGTSKVITVSPALTEAPADNDTFLILGRIDG